MSERGSVPILPIIIAVALGVGLAASMFLNWTQYQQMQDDKRQLQGTITDLQYELKQESKTASPSPSASPTTSPSPSPVPTPAPTATPVLGSQALSIPQLGVSITTSPPITDLRYAYVAMIGTGGVPLAVANLNSPSLTAAYPSCGAATSLGQLVRRPNTSNASKFIKKIGAYNYYYVSVPNCGNTPAAKAAVTEATNTLIATILPTIQ